MKEAQSFKVLNEGNYLHTEILFRGKLEKKE